MIKITKARYDAIRRRPGATEREYPRDWEVLTEVYLKSQVVASRTVRASGTTYMGAKS